MHQLTAVIAHLDWCLAIAIATLLWWLHIGDRAMRLDHTGKVEHQAVVGVALDPHATACHLHIQTGAHGRAQHHHQIDVWIVKAGRQHIGICERTHTTCLEVGQHALALFLWCLASHALSSHTLLAQDFGHVLGMLHASTEKQPRLSLTGQSHDLMHHGLIFVVGIHSGLQLGLDELATTLLHARHIQLGLGDLRAQRGQITLEHQLLDADRL